MSVRMFSSLPEAFDKRTKSASASLCAAFCFQIAALAFYTMHSLPAAALVTIAILILRHRTKQAGGGLKRTTIMRLKDAFATVVILSALLRIILNFGMGGGFGFRGDGKKAVQAKNESPSASLDHSGIFTGVILLPEEERHTVLVPPLPAMRSALFKSKEDNPLSIPFYGSYWFFKFPDRRPPLNSFVTRGSPAEVTFRAPDHRALQMEAHQNLGKLIDLACCREIQIAIRNADQYAGSVSIELILMNTTVAGSPSVSLGRAAVKSMPHRTPQGTDPVREVLSFRIPSDSPIQQFDELVIRFPREVYHADRSARIAIDRFVLMPHV